MKSSLVLIQKDRALLSVIAAFLLITGCTRTVPVSYYQLSSVDSSRSVAVDTTLTDSIIGIGPVTLPDYLDRPQMVIAMEGNQVQLADNHRWIEPLTQTIPRVLREDLAILLHSENILLYPWERDVPVSCQVVIDFVHFEGKGYKTGYLEAIWSIRDGKGKMVLPQKRSNFTVAAKSPDHEGLAAALSDTLFLLCREIAQAMQEKSVAGGS